MEFSKYRQYALFSILIAVSCLARPAFSGPQLLPPLSKQAGQMPTPPLTSSNQTPTGSFIPKDPEELLLAAAWVNGLDLPGLKPWHILVSYDKYDEDGDNVDSGTYEEFWAGPKQYRLSYTSHDFTQTDIATEEGLYRTGAEKWPGELQTRVRDEFVRPMFREMNLQYAKPEEKKLQLGKTKLPCVLLRRSDMGTFMLSENVLAAFCFEPDSLILRYSKGGVGRSTRDEQTIYDKIVQLQGRYVASDVRVMRLGKLSLKMHVEKLESVGQLNMVDFTPPPNAALVKEELVVVEGRVLMLDYLLHLERFIYPQSIHLPSVKAVVKYVIGKEGHVTRVEFVEGAPELQEAIEENLREYVFRPFIVRGEPVEVEATQQFVFGAH
jgi:Gram-negative bacterial TonB protein C-terminal